MTDQKKSKRLSRSAGPPHDVASQSDGYIRCTCGSEFRDLGDWQDHATNHRENIRYYGFTS